MKYNIKDFSLDEKLSLLTGYAHGMQTNGLNGKLPYLWLSDGPNGLRYLDTSTGVMITRKSIPYPTNVVMGNSWSKQMVRETANGIADECIENDVAVLLAPGVNIKRTPLCGRNFEYYSEDPYLSGILGREFIKGIQEKGIGTSLKHFACNNREFERYAQNSEVDERTLREIYFRQFEIALEAKPWTVMCSYNLLNGVYASENKKLLKNILRNEYKFDGLIVSDWGAVHDRVKALRATLDLEMPYNANCVQQLKEGLEKGYISENDVDNAVINLLNLCEKYENAKELRKVTTTLDDRMNLTRRAAEEGIVLLKNEGVLPLKNGKNILIAGDYAECALYNGGGSSKVEPIKGGDSLQTSLRKVLPDSDVFQESGQYFSGDHLTSPMFMHTFRKSIIRAEERDYAIVVVGNNSIIESEAYDRYSIKLNTLSEEMIKRIAKVNKNTIVIIEAGSAIDMSDWIDDVKAVVFAGFGGILVNEALANILSGKTNPSGKLSETFPFSIHDTPTGLDFGNSFSERYKEGIMVGYRYYDYYNKNVLFPFGYGLSYSTFEYSNLKIKKVDNYNYDVSYTIKNTSDVDGKEISEVYVSDVFSMVERPIKELKEFSKDFIKAHESKTITVHLDKRAFAYYNTSFDDWFVEDGKFRIMVGSSSRDIKLEETIIIETDKNLQQSI